MLRMAFLYINSPIKSKEILLKALSTEEVFQNIEKQIKQSKPSYLFIMLIMMLLIPVLLSLLALIIHIINEWIISLVNLDINLIFICGMPLAFLITLIGIMGIFIFIFRVCKLVQLTYMSDTHNILLDSIKYGEIIKGQVIVVKQEDVDITIKFYFTDKYDRQKNIVGEYYSKNANNIQADNYIMILHWYFIQIIL